MLLFQFSLPTSFRFLIPAQRFCSLHSILLKVKRQIFSDKNKLTSSLGSRQREYQTQSWLYVGSEIENFSIFRFVSLLVFFVVARSAETHATQPRRAALRLKGVCRIIICQLPSMCVRFTLRCKKRTNTRHVEHVFPIESKTNIISVAQKN